MKKRYVILLTSLITMLVTSVAVTAAWFAQGSDLYVTNFNISFGGDKNLFISTTGQENSFKEQLTKDELNWIDSFSPVSSMNSNEWLEAKLDKPEFKSGYASSGENPIPTVAETGYYSQELYLYSEDDILATVDKDTFAFTANEIKNKTLVETVKETYPTLTDEEILENLNNVIKSLRVSILVPDEDNYSYVIIDPYKEGDTLLGGNLDTNNDGYFDSYSKNGTSYETFFGTINDRSKLVYDDAKSSDSTVTGITTCFNAKTPARVKHFNLEKTLANGGEIEKEKSVDLNGIESALRIPVESFIPTKIVLSIYLEGWDRDNTNLAMFASFMINVKFKILRGML